MLPIYTPYAHQIDLVPGMHTNPDATPPEQGGWNGCQTWTGALGLEVKHQRAGQPIRVNRPASYRMAMDRAPGGFVGNNGARVEDLDAAWRSRGVPTASPGYNSAYDPIPEDVYADAARYKGVELETIPYITAGAARDNTIMSMHKALDAGDPILATFRMTASFDNDARGYYNWLLMNWDASYATGGPSRGEHVVLILGIDWVHEVFLFANHWGAEWGDGGFGGAPFDKFLQGPQYCFTNLQIIKKCAVGRVGVRTVPNPTPTSQTPDQLGAFYTSTKAILQVAYNAGVDHTDGLTKALIKAIEMNLSDKQFEICAPVLGGLPRGIVREFADRGDLGPNFQMRWELGA